MSEIEYGVNWGGPSLACPRCGVLVADREAHGAYHDRIDQALGRLGARERYEAEALERED